MTMPLQPHPAERSPRPVSPEGDRANARALAWLEAWLLALLLPLLGERAARAVLATLTPHRQTLIHVGPYCVHAETAAQFGEAEIRLLIPFLFVIGPGPHRGMRPNARTTSITPPPHARAPPGPKHARNPSPPPSAAPRAEAITHVHKQQSSFSEEKEAKRLL